MILLWAWLPYLTGILSLSLVGAVEARIDARSFSLWRPTAAWILSPVLAVANVQFLTTEPFHYPLIVIVTYAPE